MSNLTTNHNNVRNTILRDMKVLPVALTTQVNHFKEIKILNRQHKTLQLCTFPQECFHSCSQDSNALIKDFKFNKLEYYIHQASEDKMSKLLLCVWDPNHKQNADSIHMILLTLTSQSSASQYNQILQRPKYCPPPTHANWYLKGGRTEGRENEEMAQQKNTRPQSGRWSNHIQDISCPDSDKIYQDPPDKDWIRCRSCEL
jgi:hypothetical protein